MAVRPRDKGITMRRPYIKRNDTAMIRGRFPTNVTECLLKVCNQFQRSRNLPEPCRPKRNQITSLSHVPKKAANMTIGKLSFPKYAIKLATRSNASPSIKDPKKTAR